MQKVCGRVGWLWGTEGEEAIRESKLVCGEKATECRIKGSCWQDVADNGSVREKRLYVEEGPGERLVIIQAKVDKMKMTGLSGEKKKPKKTKYVQQWDIC